MKRFWAGSAILLGLIGFLLVQRLLEPSYDGKRVREWFAESVEQSTRLNDTSKSFRALCAMEGRAVPYLTRWVNARQSRLDTSYEAFRIFLPERVRAALPLPRAEWFYSDRRKRALELLGYIGNIQRAKVAAGEAIVGVSVGTAVPAIRLMLHDTNVAFRGMAAQTLMLIGPPAAPAVPDLIELARRPNEEALRPALSALGSIGPAASDAIELMSQIIANEHPQRMAAIIALGRMGPIAQSAAFTLVSALSDTNEAMRVEAARALGQIGVTPPEAIPALKLMWQGANNSMKTVAALALWNANREDVRLTTELMIALQPISLSSGMLASSLGYLGTNAAPFLSEIQKRLDDPNINVRRAVMATVRKIKPVQP